LKSGPHIGTRTIPGDEAETSNARWSVQWVYSGLNVFRESRRRVSREEETSAEPSELCLSLGKGEVREDGRKQLLEKFVVVDGPSNPETEATHPEQSVFHVELYAGV
jgi:hypothetical protein